MRAIPHPDRSKPRLLLDECVPKDIFHALQDQKFDTQWVGEECPEASDRAVIDLAARERRILVTLDKGDFGAILKGKTIEIAGLVLFRIPAKPLEDMNSIFLNFFEEYGNSLAGRITVYKENSIRQRPLPL